MIKVLHFVTVMDRAGQETFIMNVYRSADRTKYKFVFLCDTNRKGDYDDEIIDLGGEIFHLPERINNHGIKRYREEISLLKNWLLNNKDKDILVYIDNEITTEQRMSFHPNTNEKTIFIKTTDLMLFIESIGYQVNIIDL